MQEQNTKNAIFLGGIFSVLLLVIFTVAMITYVGKAGAWSAILPLVAEGYGVYSFVKKVWKYKDGKKVEE